MGYLQPMQTTYRQVKSKTERKLKWLKELQKGQMDDCIGILRERVLQNRVIKDAPYLDITVETLTTKNPPNYFGIKHDSYFDLRGVTITGRINNSPIKARL